MLWSVKRVARYRDWETVEVEPEWGDANKVFTKEAYEKSLENLRNKLSANPFLDPEYWNNMVNVAGYQDRKSVV